MRPRKILVDDIDTIDELFDDGIPEVWFEYDRRLLRDLGIDGIEDDEEAPLTHRRGKGEEPGVS